jgi:hypothetical protein
MKTVNNSIVNNDKVPPNSKPSCSNSLAGRTLSEDTIQYDCGANVMVSPKAPFNLETTPATSEDKIIMADGSLASVEEKTIVGNTECFISSEFPSTLVPQSTIEDSNSVTVLNNSQLNLYDIANSKKLMKAIENSQPYVTVESSNGLYFFSPKDFKQ